jgi:predicted phosphate transport protein (TIGR00153 family)
MRIPFMSMFVTSPFEGVEEHSEKMKECAWAFQQAIECFVSKKCKTFEELRLDVVRLESEADAIKRRIRGHLPLGTLMPVSKFQLFRYLREQDGVMDSLEEALDWISYRSEAGIPSELEKDFFLLVDTVIEPIEELVNMIGEARKYFQTYHPKQRNKVKDIIRNLRRLEHEADKIEDTIKRKVFHLPVDPLTAFHVIRLTEIIGSTADHAENVGDMMRAMIAR